MSYTLVQQFTGGTKVTAAVVSNIAPIPGGNISYIYTAAASYSTVIAGDGATITGSGAGNNGTYLIVSVPNPQTVIVRATLSTEAGVASATIVRGNHRLDIQNETSTSWTTIATQVNEQAIVRRAGTRRSTTGTDNNVQLVDHSLDTINIIHTGATDTEWVSEEEIVVCRQPPYNTATCRVVHGAGDPGTFNLRLGRLLNAGDKRSYSYGSVWAGLDVQGHPTRYTGKYYGSYLYHSSTTSELNVGNSGHIYGCIFNGRWRVASASQTGAGVIIQDFIIYNRGAAAAFVIVDKVAEADNFIYADGGSVAVIAFATATIVLERLGLGVTQVPRPFMTLLQSAATLKDLRTDENLADLISIATGAASEIARKSYTWNPRFTDIQNIAISGALVSVDKVDDAIPTVFTPIAGSPFTTDSNGRINAGAGTELITQERKGTPPGTITNFSYRIVIEKGLFRRVLKLVKPVEQSIDNQIELHELQHAFEGEDMIF